MRTAMWLLGLLVVFPAMLTYFGSVAIIAMCRKIDGGRGWDHISIWPGFSKRSR